MIKALGLGGIAVTLIDNVEGFAGVVGCGLAAFFAAAFFKEDVASGASADTGRAVLRSRTNTRAKAMSRMLAT